MKVNIENFIGIFENGIEEEWCDQVVNWYNHITKTQPDLIQDRQSADKISPTYKKNSFTYLHNHTHNPEVKKLCDHFMDILINKVFFEYDKKHHISTFSELVAKEIKVQKTKFEEGYHLWHYEHGPKFSDRVLVYMVYLNDVEEGGETEFLYQRRRIKPKKGTIMLFPSNFTHTHRGNPPLSNHKYAITEWICLKNP